jgi:hypothetical protein
MKQSVSRILFLALFLAGCGLTALGIIYLITPVASLPTFLGGIHHGQLHSDAYRTRRADVALILGVLALITSGWLAARTVGILRERQYGRVATPTLRDDGSGATPDLATDGESVRVPELDDAAWTSPD